MRSGTLPAISIIAREPQMIISGREKVAGSEAGDEFEMSCGS
jgi:hypothetical protein